MRFVEHFEIPKKSADLEIARWSRQPTARSWQSIGEMQEAWRAGPAYYWRIKLSTRRASTSAVKGFVTTSMP